MINVIGIRGVLVSAMALLALSGCRRSPGDVVDGGGAPVSVSLTVSVPTLSYGTAPGNATAAAFGTETGREASATASYTSSSATADAEGADTADAEGADTADAESNPNDHGGDSPVTGKAIADADQDKIASLQILQYAGASSGGGLLSHSRYLTFDNPASGSATHSFMARSAPGSRFVVIANSPEILELPQSYNEAIASGYRFGEDPAARLDALKYLPMSGVSDPVDVGVSSGSGQSVSVTLTRLFARIQVNVKAGGGIASDFNIRRVQVRNLPVTMLYLWTGAEPTSVPMFDAAPVELPGEGSSSWSGSFCVPENRQGEDPYVSVPMEKYGNGKPSATYIEVTGDHITDGGSSVDRYLLRLYPGANATTDYNIERGGLYTVEATLTALEPADKRLTSSIPWFDQQQITLGGAGDHRTVTVHWSGKPFTIRTSDLPAWLTVSPAAGGVEAGGAGVTEVTFTASEYNVTGLDRECTVTLLREGMAVGTLKVKQLATLFILDSPQNARITWPGTSTAVDQATVQFRNTTFTATLMGEDAAHFEIVNARDVYGTLDGVGAYTFQLRPRTTILATEGKSAQLVLTPTAGEGNNLIQPVTLNLVHNVNFKKPANCFMIAPGESFSFDVTKAGNDDAGTSTWSQALKAKVKSVALLWQTAADGEYSKESGGGELVLGTGSNIVLFDPDSKVATVNTNKRAGLGGNAVVAAYDGENGTGNILWSWHVWVTNYNPSEIGEKRVTATNQKVVVSGGEVHTYGVEYQKVNAGKVIMDRNLGAVKTYNYGAPPAGDNSVYKMWGYFYQWGRKDPMPQAYIDAAGKVHDAIAWYDGNGAILTGDRAYRVVSISASGVISGTNALAFSVHYPGVFIKASTDWYCTATNNRNDNLWSSTQTLYDPCPRGWKVPVRGTFNDFTGKDSGWNVSVNSQTTNLNQGTFPYYRNGAPFVGAGNVVTSGNLYRDGISTTPNPRPIAWWPAGGFRTASIGTINNPGYDGYNYTSGSNTDGTVACMNLHGRGLNNNINYPRSHGFQIRCVQE